MVGRRMSAITMPATPRNSEMVLEFIRRYMQENGYSPSLRDIGVACELSIPSIILCLTWLEGQGRIRRQAGIARSIVVIDMDKGTG